AEDGIRDFHVTGVQTCALPISRVLIPEFIFFCNSSENPTLEKFLLFSSNNISWSVGVSLDRINSPSFSFCWLSDKFFTFLMSGRSEERRVGRECRSRSGTERRQ